MVSKGLFIVCEGIDGCGKTTQAQMLVNWIFSNYKAVDSILLTREPTKSKYGLELSQRLREMKSFEENKERLLELFVLDREQHVDNQIIPLLEQKAIIICDRYKYSTIAYQAAQGIPVARTIDDNAGFPIPDLVLIFNASVDNCVKRMHGKQGMDTFEKKDFLERVKANYANLPKLLPKEKFHIINANASIEQVHQDVLKEIKPLLDSISK